MAQERLNDLETQGLSAKEVFSRVYREELWGRSGKPEQPFYSGTGSHSKETTSEYIQKVSEFIKSFNAKPNALDLGCGDFNVGSQVRQYCASYIACDIVNELIEFNKEKFRTLNVDFRVLDLIEDNLPSADVVFIRQVLQHLSNEHIKEFLINLKNKFSWMIVTEHLPFNQDFTHNLDQHSGHKLRLYSGSGVVLTSPPFNLSVIEEKVLCEVRDGSGIIKTIAYRL